MTWYSLLRLGALVYVAVTCVVVGDTAGKLLMAQGINAFHVAWSRFFMGVVLLLPFSGLQWRDLPVLQHALTDWRVVLRGGLIAAGIASILTALQTEPIANVFGAFFIGPIVSYALSVVVLKERPGRSRTGLLCIGFVGVMLVVKPHVGVSVGMLFALLAGAFYGAYLMMTRLVAGRYRPRLLLLTQLLIGSVLLLPFAYSAGMPALGGLSMTLLTISAAGSAAGNYLLVVANRVADASLIAPLVYTQLLSATLAGVLVFHELPDTLALLGLVLILLSGLGSLLLHARYQQR